MSSPILPIGDPSGPAAVPPPAAPAADYVADFVAALAAESSPTVEAARGGPSPEVLAQMAAAGLISDQLREGGHALRFSTPGPGERVRIELTDREGKTVRSVSATEAVELAAGATPQ